MTTERDPRSRIVLSWLREEAHENAERVLLRALDQVDTTPQRRSVPAWRNFHMHKLVVTAAAAATGLVVAVVGYNLLPGLGMVGPGARLSPSPAPLVLAQDSWIDHDWGLVELEATLDGSSVTGQMMMGRADETGHLVVDLQCARTREDGLIAIGGHITNGSGRRITMWPEGTLAGIVLPGGAREQLSRKLAGFWVGSTMGHAGTETNRLPRVSRRAVVDVGTLSLVRLSGEQSS